ncbi:chromate transporter [Streptosporangium becharense]|uniref:Chromate transporter n=1 Tax=Streptosporangium becharense TaxID=1816182 RepID=A0A7W9IFM2_9ACTN|nr:chromate transporter [Streptosporangium becharense]MBB2909603.1 chromate transporter [Streptosporangium becharense]MBB5819441.1 chromate transporter [Streptosporangium becharense]
MTETPRRDGDTGTGPDLRELVRLFLRLGTVAFGGPAAHIAMMHDEVVRRRGWVTEQRFLDLVGATNLIPGPSSTELAIHLGHERAGRRGLVAAGVCFILPAALMVGVLAALYVRYGTTPAVEGVLYGIRPVVVAIIVWALFPLVRTALKSAYLWALAGAALAGYLLGVNELLLLAGGGLLTTAVRLAPAARARLRPGAPAPGGPDTSASGTPAPGDRGGEPPPDGRTGPDGTFRDDGPGRIGGLLAAPLALAGSQDPDQLLRLFLTMLKIGAVLYGSGYVLLAFLEGDFVERLGWLTESQLADAVSIGQFTPGPVFTTATFVGYVIAGVPGAALATVAIFLPSFLFVGLLTKITDRIRSKTWSSALLDGVNAAALALMAGVTLQLGHTSLVDPLTWALTGGALLVLWRTRLNSAWLIAAGAGVGLAAVLLG